MDRISERIFHEDKMYVYIKNYATSHDMTQTLRALPFAKEKHQGQFRNGEDKVPYIYHPLMIASHAIWLGLDEDSLVAAALLHDVCEDCGVLPEELPVEEEAREAVRLLTKEDTPDGKTREGKEKYFTGISYNRIAVMVKLLDRCHNVSGMGLSFTTERINKYIRETEDWIYPLMDKAERDFKEYSGQVSLLKYQIVSTIKTLKKQLSK